jgi:hypothetical protein
VDVHLVRSIVNAPGPGRPVHAVERSVGRKAFGPVDLDGPVDHVVQHLGAGHLDGADLHPSLLTLINPVGGVQGQQPGGLNLGVGVEDHLLDELLAGQGFAEGHPAVGPITHEFEGALSLAEPTHAVEDASRSESILGDLKALASRAEQVFFRHPDVVVDDLGVSAVVTKDRNITDDVVARGIRGNDDLAEGLMIGGIGLGANHEHPK